MKNIKIFSLIFALYSFGCSNLLVEENLNNKIYKNLKTLMTPGGLFEELGLRYIGPIDGLDVKTILRLTDEQ